MRRITQFWQFAIVLYIITFPLQVFPQTATPPSVGDGSEGNPYQIATLENLYWLTQSDTVWDKHFIQIADIDALASVNWDNGVGFTPVGNSTMPFVGGYNGKGHIIDNIYIYRPQRDYIGLFGYLDANSYIDSLGLTNIDITGEQYVGGLAGKLKGGRIINCFTAGVCSSENGYYFSGIGGLVGWNVDEISNCYSNVHVSSALDDIGGLVGVNKGLISNSYSRGYVNYSSGSVGGLVGYNDEGSVVSCFWDTERSYQSTSSGGTGLTTYEMQNIKNYLVAGWDLMDEKYNGNEDIWGHNIGENGGYPFLGWQGYANEIIACQAPFSSVSNIVLTDVNVNSINLKSFTPQGYGTSGYAVYINSVDIWEIPVDGSEHIADSAWQNNGQQCVYFGTSNNPNVSVTGLSENTKYYFKVYAYTDCSGIETYEQTGTLISQSTKVGFITPVGDGSESNPYIIANLNNLVWLMYSDTAWNKHFIQTADIDASSSINWDGGKGFTPIGNSSKAFTGSYNGKGHNIDSLIINRPTEDNMGLFGKAASIQIDSLGLINADIIGNSSIGGLIGYLYSGQVTNCYVKGTIKGEGNKVGGLIGKNYGVIVNSYSIADVMGINLVGGLVGENNVNPYSLYIVGTISNSYSAVNVEGNNSVGGFVGENRGFITNSYSKGNVSGKSLIGGLVGYNVQRTIYSIGSSRKGTIFNSYSLTRVTGDNSIGGLIGSYSVYGSISSVGNFWDTETSGLSISDGGEGLTTLEMQDIKTYLNVGWDFMDETYNGTEDIWGFNSSENNGYPFLHWQGFTNSIECQAPFSPVSDIVFGDVLANAITLESYTKSGYGTSGYSIYINTEDTWTFPVDGTEPNADTSWQNNGQQCIYFGASNNPNLTVTGLLGNTKYYFKIYSYSDCNEIKKYEQIGMRVSQITHISATLPIGDGSESNPFEITTLENLYWLTQSDTVWDKNFIQTADIDAALSINWDSGAGFTPIGNSTAVFVGSFNGKGHNVDSIYINRPEKDYIGFFGYVNNAHLDSMKLTNISIKGRKYIGGLAGYLNGGHITNCSVAGTCSSNNSNSSYVSIGGLVGYNEGEINFCYSDLDVSSTYDIVGGFVGINDGVIKNCYSTGDVIGKMMTGGFAGHNLSSIQNCYSRSSINANTSFVGGFAGSNDEGSVVSCFWDTETSGQGTSDGGEGLTTSEMQNSENYLISGWDFMDATYNGINDIWGLNSNENDGYPFLQWQGYANTDISTAIPEGDGSINNPYIIANLENLEFLMRNRLVWNRYYIQSADIDASASINWDEGRGFTPIGNSTTAFKGSYDGKEYIIDNLYINRSKDSFIGLFGNVEISANIENLGLTNIDIKGGKYLGGIVGYLKGGNLLNCYSSGKCTSSYSDELWAATGGLVGFNEGNINSCYSNVNVSSYYDAVGGLVGINANKISCSYSIGIVLGINEVGGLAGFNEGRISFCYSDAVVSSNYNGIGGFVGVNIDFISCSYSTGNVLGNSYVGGFAGYNSDFILQCYSRSNVKANTDFCGGLIGDNYGYVVSGFWDTEASGQSTSFGGEGLTTSDMKKINPYYNSGWDFMDEWTNGIGDYWGLNSSENDGYPFLYWQGYTNTAPIPTDINGIENTDISIYPNPVSEVLNITTTDEAINRLVISDINGKKIIERNVVNRTETIDMSSLNSGIYLINIYKGNDVFTSKIIKR